MSLDRVYLRISWKEFAAGCHKMIEKTGGRPNTERELWNNVKDKYSFDDEPTFEEDNEFGAVTP